MNKRTYKSDLTTDEKVILSHFKWATFPFRDGSAQKHPHPNPPPSEGEGMTGGPTFVSLPRQRGMEYYLPTQFEKKPEKVLMSVMRAAQIFKRAHASVFGKYGLSFPQYNVLRVLKTLVKGRNKLTDVSRIMRVPGANMTGLAKRMEKIGFIVRKSDPSDERVTVLKITPKGRKTLNSIEEEKDDWLEVLLKGFSRAERLQLLSMVKQLIKNNVRFATGESPVPAHHRVQREGK